MYDMCIFQVLMYLKSHILIPMSEKVSDTGVRIDTIKQMKSQNNIGLQGLHALILNTLKPYS